MEERENRPGNGNVLRQSFFSQKMIYCAADIEIRDRKAKQTKENVGYGVAERIDHAGPKTRKHKGNKQTRENKTKNRGRQLTVLFRLSDAINTSGSTPLSAFSRRALADVCPYTAASLHSPLPCGRLASKNGKVYCEANKKIGFGVAFGLITRKKKISPKTCFVFSQKIDSSISSTYNIYIVIKIFRIMLVYHLQLHSYYI